jgi:RimJ/RimL family protein N-acetyltransferase
MSAGLTAHWPLFGLRLRTGDLELRVPTDGDLAELVDVARAGVHPPERMPFLVAWTDKPPGRFEREFLQYHWGCRASWTAEDWTVDFAVRHRGRVVGCQGIGAREFRVTRTVVTGSWLGQAFQGRGIGTGMRAAVLALAFDGLGALEAHSGAFADNPESAAVSRKLGYRPAGRAVHVRRGERAVEHRYVLDRDAWRGADRPAVEIGGLEDCIGCFGST